MEFDFYIRYQLLLILTKKKKRERINHGINSDKVVYSLSFNTFNC